MIVKTTIEVQDAYFEDVTATGCEFVFLCNEVKTIRVQKKGGPVEYERRKRFTHGISGPNRDFCIDLMDQFISRPDVVLLDEEGRVLETCELCGHIGLKEESCQNEHFATCATKT
ncbi:hypothetical protein LCGC14_2771830 [marine sediment metagenome]|uniref:Uncharacterized protein n=1 Tax=marine sediment metagenome TaxID=412755 RepID=A0A0F9B4K7_9ZZZZ